MLLRAKYVMPSSHELFENGAVRVADDAIVDVGPFERLARDGSAETVDLGEIALLPGFINAHTHLELGGLAGQLPPPRSFPKWVAQISARRDRNLNTVHQTTAEGAKASIEAGTTTLVDISYTGFAYAALKESPIRARAEFETIQFEESRCGEAADTLIKRLQSAEPDALTTVGVSPHAPYSVSAPLYQRCVDLSMRCGYPISSHVAETEEEERFLQDGTGAFAEMLTDFGVDISSWKPPGKTPARYLYELGFFNASPLIAHGNYIRSGDIPILRDLNITVVYCPRSHDYFGHGDHPFERLFSLGVNIALGTDSLASAPSLSMLDEMRFAARKYPHIAPERILTFATLNGAKTTRVSAKIGGLRAGWKADIVGLAIPNGKAPICERLLDDETRVVFTMIDGAVCYHSTAEHSSLSHVNG